MILQDNHLWGLEWEKLILAWKMFHKEFLDFVSQWGNSDGSLEEASQWEIYRNLAIENYVDFLDSIWTVEQQIQKIEILLILVQLHDRDYEQWTRVDFFYQAVELLERYQMYVDKYQSIIVDAYIQYINTEFGYIFPEAYRPTMSGLIYTKILSEYNIRLFAHLEESASADFVSDTDTPLQIIQKLEQVFWVLRILVFSEESGEICMEHRCCSSDVGTFLSFPMNTSEIEIFDIPRKYHIAIDHGSSEMANQCKKSQLEHIIYPIIGKYIQKKWYDFFQYASDNSDTIVTLESAIELKMTIPLYTEFISSVTDALDPLEFHRAHESETYIEDCEKAIAISRMIFLSRNSDKSFLSIVNLDRIMWWTINRNIFNLVQSILLSSHENMNGIGYPFWLSKKSIPLEWRIYALIRSFEALSLMKNRSQVIETLKEWCTGWYYDTDICIKFITFLQTHDYECTTLKSPIPDSMTPHRTAQYEKYISHWTDILDRIDVIEDLYNHFRWASWDYSTQSVIIKKANESVLGLIKIANIRKLFILTRHGATESDIDGWPPGNTDELLVSDGEISSLLKWDILSNLQLRIFASPLIRARQTAAIICQKVRHCVLDIVPIDGHMPSCDICPWVIIERSMENPKKHADNGRYNSFIQKLLADDTNGLMKFLVNIAFSAEESTNLCILHRDSARHMIFWLENLFSQNGATGTKVAIDNNLIYEFFFRWNHIIEAEKDKKNMLLFSIFTWKEAISEINTFSWDIFWEAFQVISSWRIDLIQLHDAFCDFLDLQYEQCPEKVRTFLEISQSGEYTENFKKILKEEGIG